MQLECRLRHVQPRTPRCVSAQAQHVIVPDPAVADPEAVQRWNYGHFVRSHEVDPSTVFEAANINKLITVSARNKVAFVMQAELTLEP